MFNIFCFQLTLLIQRESKAVDFQRCMHGLKLFQSQVTVENRLASLSTTRKMLKQIKVRSIYMPYGSSKCEWNVTKPKFLTVTACLTTQAFNCRPPIQRRFGVSIHFIKMYVQGSSKGGSATRSKRAPFILTRFSVCRARFFYNLV